MGLDDLVRSVVATAATLTGDFQPTVSHKAATGARDAKGRPVLGAAVSRQAIVTDAREIVPTAGGEQIVCRTRVVFLGAVAVGPEDEIALPDGKVLTIRRVNAGALAHDATKFVTVVLCD